MTGGAGFLGSHLCEALLERGDEVVAIDNLVTGNVANIEPLFGRGGFRFVEHDVSNYVWVPGDVDAVLHFASPASPVDYLEIPIQTLKVGSLGTHNLLGLSKVKGARFLLASTSEVYGDPEVHPQTEDYWGHVNPVGPRGVYDEAKRFAEAMTMAYHRYHGLDVRIVRIFNSILADEQVLYDDGELRRERVGDLAARLGGQVDLDGYRVPAFGRERAHWRGGGLGAGRPPADWGVLRSAYALRPGHQGHRRPLAVRGGVDGEARRPYGGRAGDRRPRRDRRAGRRSRAGPAEVSVIEAGEVGRAPPTISRSHGRAWARCVGAPLRTARLPAVAVRWAPDPAVALGRRRESRDRDVLSVAEARRLGLRIPAVAMVRRRVAGSSPWLPVTLRITDELLWFLGLWVAEGCWQQSSHDAYINLSCDAATLKRAAKVVERDLVAARGSPRVRRLAPARSSCAANSSFRYSAISGSARGRSRFPAGSSGCPWRASSGSSRVTARATASTRA